MTEVVYAKVFNGVAIFTPAEDQTTVDLIAKVPPGCAYKVVDVPQVTTGMDPNMSHHWASVHPGALDFSGQDVRTK